MITIKKVDNMWVSNRDKWVTPFGTVLEVPSFASKYLLDVTWGIAEKIHTYATIYNSELELTSRGYNYLITEISDKHVTFEYYDEHNIRNEETVSIFHHFTSYSVLSYIKRRDTIMSRKLPLEISLLHLIKYNNWQVFNFSPHSLVISGSVVPIKSCVDMRGEVACSRSRTINEVTPPTKYSQGLRVEIQTLEISNYTSPSDFIEAIEYLGWIAKNASSIKNSIARNTNLFNIMNRDEIFVVYSKHDGWTLVPHTIRGNAISYRLTKPYADKFTNSPTKFFRDSNDIIDKLLGGEHVKSGLHNVKRARKYFINLIGRKDK